MIKLIKYNFQEIKRELDALFTVSPEKEVEAKKEALKEKAALYRASFEEKMEANLLALQAGKEPPYELRRK